MSRTRWPLVGVSLALILAASPATWAQQAQPHTEVRDFVIQVGNKTAGQYQLTVTHQPDGTENVAINASVEVKVFLGRYTYAIQATEVWKDYRLQQLRASGQDDGKRFDVSAVAEGNGLRVRANGQEHVSRADAWTTSYWKLAEARFHNQNIPLLDCDTGKDIDGKLQYVSMEQMNVAGQTQKCYHFRILGPAAPVDVWYDSHHRLVRQEFTDSGQHTIFHLTAIKR